MLEICDSEHVSYLNVADSSKEGLFKVMVYSQNGTFLGETKILYMDLVEEVLKQAVRDPGIMQLFVKAAIPCLNEHSKRSSCDTVNSTNAGRWLFSALSERMSLYNKLFPVQ